LDESESRTPGRAKNVVLPPAPGRKSPMDDEEWEPEDLEEECARPEMYTALPRRRFKEGSDASSPPAPPPAAPPTNPALLLLPPPPTTTPPTLLLLLL